MTALAVTLGLVLPLVAVQRAWAEGGGWELLMDYGFPAAVAAFVLIRLEPRVEKLTEAITQLTVAMARREGSDARPDQSVHAPR